MSSASQAKHFASVSHHSAYDSHPTELFDYKSIGAVFVEPVSSSISSSVPTLFISVSKRGSNRALVVGPLHAQTSSEETTWSTSHSLLSYYVQKTAKVI